MYYTSEKNTLMLISLLKEHGIRRIIVSPGATNVSLVASVQIDSFFEVYSAVDERAAAFMACGLASETGEPVVLSCTGATASRNYIPGLTEAYYKNLPILAVTSSLHTGQIGNYVPQLIDRSSQFNDMVRLSVQLPTICSHMDEITEITMINRAILELTHKKPGPVHINLVTNYSYDFSVRELPKYRTIRRVSLSDCFPPMKSGKIGIFVGSHAKFSEELTKDIDNFCLKNNAIVICDQTSNYRGKYRVLASLTNVQNCKFVSKEFELIIYIGYVSGGYIAFNANEIWRVNPDGEIRDLNHKLTYVFEMEERDFFKYYAKGDDKDDSFIHQCLAERKALLAKIKDIPFSNIWIARQLASYIPENSVWHFAILNSLRAWNFFETPESVRCYSNTGGFGIDGCVSSLIGAALVDSKKQYFGVVGDLAFFYDMNCLEGMVPNNVHIMVVNNGMGAEFKNYNHRAAMFGDRANEFIAAKGHNGGFESSVLKRYSEAHGFIYLSASCKTEYINMQKRWLEETKGPVIFEVFTNDREESDALKKIVTIAEGKNKVLRKMKMYAKQILRR